MGNTKRSSGGKRFASGPPATPEVQKQKKARNASFNKPKKKGNKGAKGAKDDGETLLNGTLKSEFSLRGLKVAFRAHTNSLRSSRECFGPNGEA